MKQKIIHYIRAGYPALYIVSSEEQRVEAELKAVAQELQFTLHVWSVVEGLMDTATGHHVPANDPLEVLQAIHKLKEKSILLLKDFHLFLLDPNPLLVRRFKDALLEAKTTGKTLVILGCRLLLPPELERELVVIDFALPNKTQLEPVLNGILASANLDPLSAEARDKVLDAATGMTTMEAENAFALSVVEQGRINPGVVAREKALTIKKNGLLEIITPRESLNSIGGLDILKQWLVQRQHAFGPEARAYGLPTPRGLLILGLAGTGKSLCAKVTASVFGVPLLKLDAGRIFAGLVGQSEANLRQVIQTAEAIAPCCLWIDELDKGFSGSKGSIDGGTSARVLGSFLSWMQEKESPVFVVATANDVTQLPPELLRKGRWDELFFVDLPQQPERESIWSIQIAKHGRHPKEYDLAQLAKATEGLTGSEIEQAFIESLYQAFAVHEEPTDLTIAQVLNDLVPLSKLMSEQITNLRTWARGRARMATSPVSGAKLRKLSPVTG